MPLVARLEDQVGRAAFPDLVPEERADAAREAVRVLVLAAHEGEVQFTGSIGVRFTLDGDDAGQRESIKSNRCRRGPWRRRCIATTAVSTFATFVAM